MRNTIKQLRKDISSGKHKNALGLIKDSPTKIPSNSGKPNTQMAPSEGKVVVNNKKGLVSFK